MFWEILSGLKFKPLGHQVPQPHLHPPHKPPLTPSYFSREIKTQVPLQVEPRGAGIDSQARGAQKGASQPRPGGGEAVPPPQRGNHNGNEFFPVTCILTFFLKKKIHFTNFFINSWKTHEAGEGKGQGACHYHRMRAPRDNFPPGTRLGWERLLFPCGFGCWDFGLGSGCLFVFHISSGGFIFKMEA